MIRRGHLHWIAAPDGKVRPALIMSVTRRNQAAEDVVIVPCSSQQRYGPWHVILAKGEGGVRAPSVLRCEEVTTIRKSRVGDRMGGPLSAERLAQVQYAIASALGFGGDVL